MTLTLVRASDAEPGPALTSEQWFELAHDTRLQLEGDIASACCVATNDVEASIFVLAARGRLNDLEGQLKRHHEMLALERLAEREGA